LNDTNKPVVDVRRGKWRYAFWIVRGVETILLLLGSGAFFGGCVCSMFGPKYPLFASSVEFPLSDPQDVVADERGLIYVALGFYGRVQVYVATGTFLRGFFVNVDGGAFRLKIDKPDSVTVVSARGNKVLLYDSKGGLVQTKPDKDRLFLRLETRPWKGFRDSTGRTYQIHNRYFSPRIVRVEHGTTSLEIQTPALLTPLIGPLPCWLSVGLSALSEFVIRKSRRMRPRVETS
jgi:hypothetical protein